MKLAFCLFHYFPYGGLQRDFLRIATECHSRGHQISVFTTKWRGNKPDFIKIHLIHPKGFSNHKRMLSFIKQTSEIVKKNSFDITIGFNKIPELDIYYAADDCFVSQPKYQNSFLRRLKSSYRTYAKIENSVFNTDSKTKILLLSALEQENYQAHYQTQASHLHLLPPGINKEFIPDINAKVTRESYRKDLNIPHGDFMLISVGSGFHTKGIDRALNAFATLPDTLKSHCHYFIVGHCKNLKKYKTMAASLHIETQIHFLGLRDDVPQLFQAADLTIHLSRNESAGHAILESLVSGCPILVTENCGYAAFIQEATAGIVIQDNPSTQEISQEMKTMLNTETLLEYKKNALAFSERTDLFSLVSRAADFIESISE